MTTDSSQLTQINDLPNPETLYKTCQSLAMLDAILDPAGNFRYFGFDQYWDDQQAMAEMHDGDGSHYFIMLSNMKEDAPPYAVGKLFAKSLTQTADAPEITNIANNAPLQDFLVEEAFKHDEASFYFYQLANESVWSVTPAIEDIPFLGFLAHKEAAYIPWARDYYQPDFEPDSEITIDEQIVADIFAYKPLNKEMVQRLNPLVNIDQLVDDILDIGYPVDMG